MFSPTSTSALFVLRKHYSTLLYHYEQVHLSPFLCLLIILFFDFAPLFVFHAESPAETVLNFLNLCISNGKTKKY
ncbi:hypothetical protein DVH24_037764 [Malus domestica]|uniref:Uncharacterized protein n=1 Tax=Malus domestica TaxID=3750 RepID=A0A498JYA7_MALDO|nr:hypothetical protein DVH24_037764 [Malus domestica]